MARPTKGNELGATTQIGVRISDETKQLLAKLGKRTKRGLSGEARLAIEEHVRMHAAEISGGKPANKRVASK